MTSFRVSLIILSVLSFAFHSLGQSVVVISDSPVTGVASANPATTSIFGGTLMISQDDATDTTTVTLDANLVAKVANANGNTTQIQEALGYGYHTALTRKFVPIPVIAVSAIIGYVAVLIAENDHLISYTNGISAVEPIKLGISTSDTKALAAAGPDPGYLVISRVGSAGLVTVTMPVAAIATASGDDCPDDLACDDTGCNSPAPSIFCPDGQKYAECECKLVYYNIKQVAGNVTALASGASLFDAMMAMSNAPTTTTASATNTGPVCTSTNSVYGCANPCCICPEGGGVVAPFLTTTVSGTTTTNCAYTAQPTEDNCPAAPVTTDLSSSPTPTSTHCTLTTDDATTTWFSCNSGGPYQVTSPGQVQGDATAPFNCKTPAIQGWTSSIALAPGCMCATTLGPIPTTSIAQLTSGTVCNPSISSTAPLYSISSLGSGGGGDGLAIPYCIIKGTKVPEVTQAFGQCYGHGDCPQGDYIVNGGTGNPSCA